MKMAESTATPTAGAAKQLLKQCNVTLLADGLQTSVINAQFFPRLGEPQKVIQTPPLAVLEFGEYTFWVEVESRRAVALDSTGDLNDASPIAELMEAYVKKTPGLKIVALGLNYFFELSLERGAGKLMLDKFLREEVVKKFGAPIQAAGFKLILRRNEYTVQLAVDPVWNNPKALSILVNYHLDSPIDGLDIPKRFAYCATEAPKLVEVVANA
jgi:hypothetical protein